MIRAREAEKALTALPGVKRLNDAPFANEFAIVLPKKSAEETVRAMLHDKIIPGIPVSRWYPSDEMKNVLLIACTEQTKSSKIEQLAAYLGGNL